MDGRARLRGAERHPPPRPRPRSAGPRRAAARWAATPVEERAAALRRFADAVEADARALAELIVREVGKRRADAEGEVAWTAASARWYADHPPAPERAGGAVVVPRPVGVVAAVTPWNVPLDHPGLEVAARPRGRQRRGVEAIRAGDGHGARRARAPAGGGRPGRRRPGPARRSRDGAGAVRRPARGRAALHRLRGRRPRARRARAPRRARAERDQPRGGARRRRPRPGRGLHRRVRHGARRPEVHGHPPRARGPRRSPGRCATGCAPASRRCGSATRATRPRTSGR